MEDSKIGLQKWEIAIYMVTTNLKSISSMKLYRELGMTQKSAWFMLNRIRTSFEMGDQMLCSMAEADETYMGRLEKNSKKLNAGSGTVGKTAVVSGKDKNMNKEQIEERRYDSDIDEIEYFPKYDVSRVISVHSRDRKEFDQEINKNGWNGVRRRLTGDASQLDTGRHDDYPPGYESIDQGRRSVLRSRPIIPDGRRTGHP